MSLDRSLKAGSSLAQHRNVLTRAERVARLTQNNEFDTATGRPLGLRKVANRKVAAGKKAGKKEEKAAEGAATPAAAGAGAAKGAAAPAAKGAGKPAGKSGGKK